jgi:hypothetical protein
MLRFLQNLAKESIPMETTLYFSCEPNGHVGKNPLQILSFKIPLPFLQSKGGLTKERWRKSDQDPTKTCRKT